MSFQLGRRITGEAALVASVVFIGTRIKIVALKLFGHLGNFGFMFLVFGLFVGLQRFGKTENNGQWKPHPFMKSESGVPHSLTN